MNADPLDRIDEELTLAGIDPETRRSLMERVSRKREEALQRLRRMSNEEIVAELEKNIKG